MIAFQRDRIAGWEGPVRNSARCLATFPIVDQGRRFAAFALTSLLSLLASPVCQAQVSTTYSYNSSNQVTQAISSTGTGVQYQYDAAGNTLSVNPITPQALSSGTPDTVNFSTAGAAASLSLTITAGQPVVLTESALTTSPSNSAVTVNVYNSAGILVASFNTASSNSVDLSNLPAGTYTVVVVPSRGTTGSLQLALNAGSSGSSGGSDETDVPLPTWALFALGAALFGIGQRATRRQRRAA
jgi:YD repeat-containing protein